MTELNKFSPRTQYHYEITICFVCKGAGYTRREEITDYHKREYEVHHDCCKTCNGSGRLNKKVTTEFTPYE